MSSGHSWLAITAAATASKPGCLAYWQTAMQCCSAAKLPALPVPGLLPVPDLGELVQPHLGPESADGVGPAARQQLPSRCVVALRLWAPRALLVSVHLLAPGLEGRHHALHHLQPAAQAQDRGRFHGAVHRCIHDASYGGVSAPGQQRHPKRSSTVAYPLDMVLTCCG